VSGGLSRGKKKGRKEGDAARLHQKRCSCMKIHSFSVIRPTTASWRGESSKERNSAKRETVATRTERLKVSRKGNGPVPKGLLQNRRHPVRHGRRRSSRITQRDLFARPTGGKRALTKLLGKRGAQATRWGSPSQPVSGKEWVIGGGGVGKVSQRKPPSSRACEGESGRGRKCSRRAKKKKKGFVRSALARVAIFEKI